MFLRIIAQRTGDVMLGMAAGVASLLICAAALIFTLVCAAPLGRLRA